MFSWRKIKRLLRKYETIVFWILVGILVVGSIFTLKAPDRPRSIIENFAVNINDDINIEDTLSLNEDAYSNINKFDEIDPYNLDTIITEPEQIVETPINSSRDNSKVNIKLPTEPKKEPPKIAVNEIKKVPKDKPIKKELFGVFKFTATPNADIIIVDDKKLPQGTPYLSKFPAGKHRVKFINTSLNKTWKNEFFLGSNETKEISHIFAEKTFGYLVITLKNAFEYGYAYVYIDNNIWQEGENNTTPLKIKLPTGKHKVEVRRTNFTCIPVDTTILIEKEIEKRISFLLTPEKSFSAH